MWQSFLWTSLNHSLESQLSLDHFNGRSTPCFSKKNNKGKKWVFNPRFSELVMSLFVFSGRTESTVAHELFFCVSLSIYSESSKSNLYLSPSYVPSCYCDSWVSYMEQRLEEMMDSMKLLESLTLPRQCMWIVLWNWIICRCRICSYYSACNLSVVSGLALPWRRRKKIQRAQAGPLIEKACRLVTAVCQDLCVVGIQLLCSSVLCRMRALPPGLTSEKFTCVDLWANALLKKIILRTNR